MSETPTPTTIKLPPSLKKRILELVDETGQSVHAFMLEAIEEKAELAERRRAFVRDALEAEREFEKTGLAYDAADVHRYLRARAEGKRAARPKPKAWRK
jgi:predicted transcriptional regulator